MSLGLKYSGLYHWSTWLKIKLAHILVKFSALHLKKQVHPAVLALILGHRQIDWQPSHREFFTIVKIPT